MTFLTFTWLLSLAVLMGVTLFAYRRARFVALPRQIPRDFGEFIHEALSHLAVHVSTAATTAKPHANKVTAYVLYAGKWSHDKFIDRVFGKTIQVPGKTASFFLKYIAEHKEERRGSVEQKAGLQK